MPASQHPPIAAAIPPLFLGTAAFNSQYNADPFTLPVRDIVRSFLDFAHTTTNITTSENPNTRAPIGFDTSPYYGPAELLLGRALTALQPPRTSYFLSTKAGRLSSDTFNLSPSWLRHSIHRSLRRLNTSYIDLIYIHDVEFVSREEVLSAIATLRTLRDEGKVRYIGISAFPVDVLCELAEAVLETTGEPLDAVLSYANYTVQNTRLATAGLQRLVGAGVGVVANGSLLGMGLLRKNGVPVGAMGDFHPAGEGLRRGCREAAEMVEGRGGKLEDVAYRWALESWADVGAVVGSGQSTEIDTTTATTIETPTKARTATSGGIGISVIGVSYLAELQTIKDLYTDILAARNRDPDALARKEANDTLAADVKKLLGERYNEVWDSPGTEFKCGEMTEEFLRSDEELWPRFFEVDQSA
ncbi:hypothetical protein TWF696_005092 [Orbilia brochopaga]|uniref:NADP-dependent oxidoreductase domain-containing protein n=1 Tax=Orbilia brochopaga TaxID=3140254 RepID=A0AAV9V2F7_9PEZI